MTLAAAYVTDGVLSDRTTATVRQDCVDREKFDTPSGWKLGMLSFEKVSGERMRRISINRRDRSLPIKLPRKKERPASLLGKSLES